MLAGVELASEIRRIAATFAFGLDDEQVEMMAPFVEAALRACERIDGLDPPRLPVRFPRSPGVAPRRAENPLNAWAWRCSVRGADGALREKRVVLKDTIPVESMPMRVGSAVLEGFVSSIDATVVSRVLESGGEVVGIATTEDLCYAAASVSASTGPVLNPWDRTRSAGGSSSGVAALVASGEAEIGIGGDQGGSIRIPASLCGVFGLKPTFGLVPYSGCVSFDPILDHIGPLTRTVQDMALFLESVAGTDGGNDPRQPELVPPSNYTAGLDAGIAGIRVGILEEGFGWKGVSELDVDSMVLDATKELVALGALVERVSIPEHRDSLTILVPLLMHSVADYTLRGDGMGVGIGGYHDYDMLAAFADERLERSHLLYDGVKLAAIVGGYLRDHFGSAYFAKARNLSLQLRDKYDAAFRDFDLLVMPTTPAKAAPLPGADASQEQRLEAGEAADVVANSGAANLTGHPALSVPIGFSNGLPVGMMLVGRHWQDALLLRAAFALQERGATIRYPPMFVGE